MSYLDFKKRALMRIINSVKGFIRTITGVNSVTLDNCVDDDSLINLKLYGNSVQDGTPAPDNPIEIQSVGELVTDESDEHYGKYKIPIKARGKNLFDVKKWYPDYLNDENGITYTNADMVAIYNIHPLKGEFKENTQYTFSVSYDTISADDSKHVFAIKMVDGEGKSLGIKPVVGTSSGTVSVVNSANTSVDYAYITYYNYTTAMSVKLSNIQIEEGSEATDYEPYHEPHTFNIWADEPIRKFESDLEALNVSDCLDIKNGCIVRNVYEEVINGTAASDWSDTYAPAIVYNKTLPAALSYSVNAARTYILSNYSVGKSSYITFANVTHDKVALGTNLYGGTTEDELIAFIEKCNNTQPFKVFYPLLEPIEEKISIPYLPTFKGTTIYEIDTTIPPSKVEAEYYSSVSDE